MVSYVPSPAPTHDDGDTSVDSELPEQIVDAFHRVSWKFVELSATRVYRPLSPLLTSEQQAELGQKKVLVLGVVQLESV